MFVRLVDHYKRTRWLNQARRGLVLDNEDPLLLRRIKVALVDLFPDEVDVDTLPWIYPQSGAEAGGDTESGTMAVPEVGSEVIVEFPYDSIYFGFYTAVWQSSATAPGKLWEDYPDTVGSVDSSGFRIVRNKSQKSIEITHPGGLVIRVDGQDGSLRITNPNYTFIGTPNEETGIEINPSTDQVNLKGVGAQQITNDIEVNNQSIIENTGTRQENIQGDKVVQIGAGMSVQVGGSFEEVVVSNKAVAISGDYSETVAGNVNKSIGGAVDFTQLVAGNYIYQALVGTITLETLLSTLFLGGIASLNGTIVNLNNGTEPAVKGQSLVNWLSAMTVPTGVGPSGTPINIADAINILSASVLIGG